MEMVGFAIVQANRAFNWVPSCNPEGLWNWMEGRIGPISAYQIYAHSDDPPQAPSLCPVAVPFGAFFDVAGNRRIHLSSDRTVAKNVETYRPCDLAGRGVFAIHDIQRKRLRVYEIKRTRV